MPLKTHVDEQPTLNLTSMIDVVFLLVVFFMVSTQYSEMEKAMDLELPRVVDGGALTDAPERRVVNVYQDGRVTLDKDNVSLAELTARLTAAHRQYSAMGVLVRGDGQGLFQRVAEVLNACKQAGINELAISVRLSEEP